MVAIYPFPTPLFSYLRLPLSEAQLQEEGHHAAPTAYKASRPFVSSSISSKSPLSHQHLVYSNVGTSFDASSVTLSLRAAASCFLFIPSTTPADLV